MLIKAQKRSRQPVFSLVLGVARQPGHEVRLLLRAGPAGEDGQVGGFDGLAVVGSEIGDSTRGGEEVALDFVTNDIAVHEHEALGNRAAACVEFVFAGVAVAADEIVAARVGDQADEPVRLGTEGRERRTLKECPGHLFGPQAGHREDGPGVFLCFSRGVRRPRCRAGRPRVAAMVRMSRWRL